MFIKAKSFHDFHKLALKGQVVLLNFGEYSLKTVGEKSKFKRRRVIKQFYKKLYKK